MKRFTAWAALCFGSCLWRPLPATSQFAPDWTTSGFDAQRSSWVRSDAKISPQSVRSPRFQLAWKRKLDNEPRLLNSLTAPALYDFYIGYRGFRSLGFLGGSSDRIFVIDTDLARVEWQKSFGSDRPPPGDIDCPGGMTANVTRPTPIGLPFLAGPRGFGRRSPATSGVGDPGQGAVTLKRVIRRPAGVSSPDAKPARQRAVVNPYIGVTRYVYALAADGRLHALYVSNGDSNKTPLKFLPPNANAHGLIVVDGVAYAATTKGCGGVEDGVWALDMETRKVYHWKAEGGVAGLAGPSFGPDGILYVATSGNMSSLVSLDPKTLRPTGRYTSEGVELTSSPLVVDYRGSDLVALTGDDGRIRLLQGADLEGNPVHLSPVYSSADFTPGALATWRGPDGAAWIVAPSGGRTASSVNFPMTNGSVSNGALTAWKIVDQEGVPALDPGWVSRDMVSPLSPIIVNGVVFAVSSGEFRSNDSSIGAVERARRSSPAVLYALDGASGQVLWESGDSIASFARGMALSAGGGYVYLVTHDGTLHSFGFPMEH